MSNFCRFIALLVHATYYLAIIGALGILYRVLAPMFTNVKTPAFVELIKNVILLPCLFIDLIDNIAEQSVPYGSYC